MGVATTVEAPRRTMLAARKTHPAPGLELVEVDLPIIGDDELLVEVAFCGICGSDLPVYHWENPPSRWKASLPRVMGHEFAGRVVWRGARVDATVFADRTPVAIEPGVTCGTCHGCRSGYPNLCVDRSIIGIDRDGAFAPYVRVPARNAFVLPASMDLRTAAFLEVFAIGVHAIERANLRPLDRVLVVGAGPIALSIVALARLAGCEVEISGLPQDVEVRLAAAVELGATAVHVVPDMPPTESFDVVFEVSGAGPGIRAGLAACRIGGRVVGVGTATADVTLDWTDMVMRAIRFTPIRARLPRHWEEAPLLLDRIDLPEAFFSTYALSTVDAAFEAARDGSAVKVLVEPTSGFQPGGDS
jgi:threonine 3-dehydrogenase